MAVNWLKGLVAPAAQFGNPGTPPSPQANGGPSPLADAPPMGGSPNPYGVVPTQPQVASAPGFAPAPTAPGVGVPDAMQWSTGTRTQGQISGVAGGAPSGAGGDRVAMLEARCSELSNDVASLALFARTLLTLLEDAKVVTRDQFLATKNRLDALDGKIDDR